jgi:uncharacterized membrane protein YvbJ
MTCKNCGKNTPNYVAVCPNCGSSMQTLTFQNNRLGENGKRAEYITEKYNMKKGVYEGKNQDVNKAYLGVIFILIVVLIIIAIAVANYLV